MKVLFQIECHFEADSTDLNFVYTVSFGTNCSEVNNVAKMKKMSFLLNNYVSYNYYPVSRYRPKITIDGFNVRTLSLILYLILVDVK